MLCNLKYTIWVGPEIIIFSKKARQIWVGLNSQKHLLNKNARINFKTHCLDWSRIILSAEAGSNP